MKRMITLKYILPQSLGCWTDTIGVVEIQEPYHEQTMLTASNHELPNLHVGVNNRMPLFPSSHEATSLNSVLD